MTDSSEPNLNNFCRLCLAESDDKSTQHDIFNEGLSNKIILILNLDVATSDCLPKQICKDCRYQLEKYHYFRLVAKSSDVRLKKHIRLCNQGKRSKVLSKEYRDDDIEELEENFLESNKYFEEAQRHVDELMLQFVSEKDRIIEFEVQKAVKELELINRPKRKSSPNKSPVNTDKPPPVLLNKLAPSNQKFNSSPALTRRKRSDILRKPVVNEVIGNYEIQFFDDDGKIVDESQQLFHKEKETEVEIIEEPEVEEVEEVSSQSDEDYKPPTSPVKKKEIVERQIVGKKTKRESLKAPKINKTVKKDLPVETGDEHYFTIVDGGEKNLDENGEKKIFQCAFENCVEKFARRQACKTHFFNHLTTKILTKGFICKFCKKCFKVASALERHERVHSGDKPFKCDFEGCEKNFSQKEMLKRHKVIHLSMEDAPFPCTICQKKFRQKDSLRRHINKEHSEDSEAQSHSFVCSICVKTFAHSSGLSRHFLIHSGKTFSCEICSKAFNDKSALKRHGNVHKK